MPQRSRRAIRDAIRASDPTLPVFAASSMEEIRRQGLLAVRGSSARCSATFGALALVLAVVGVYGVLSYSVSAAHAGVRRAHGAGRASPATCVA